MMYSFWSTGEIERSLYLKTPALGKSLPKVTPMGPRAMALNYEGLCRTRKGRWSMSGHLSSPKKL